MADRERATGECPLRPEIDRAPDPKLPCAAPANNPLLVQRLFSGGSCGAKHNLPKRRHDAAILFKGRPVDGRLAHSHAWHDDRQP